MFGKIFPTGLAALVLAAGLAGAAPSPASAQHISTQIGYSSGKGRIEVYVGKHKGKHKSKRHYRGHRAICRPGHAVHKAERRGVRHARVGGVSHRFVIVEGRHHGGRIKVAFHRDSPRCHVAWVKRGKRYGGGYYR